MTGRKREAEPPEQPAEQTPDDYVARLEVGPAQIAYEAYLESCGGRSVRGELLPQWPAQRPDVRRHWEAAAEAVQRHLLALADDEPLRFNEPQPEERES